MYRQHFGLTEHPFSNEVEPEDLFPAAAAKDCLLLLGQTELRRRLTMAVHEALAKRIVVRYHLPALTRDEVPAYLAHRLRHAGTEVALFEPAALEALFHHALHAAALARVRSVSAEHVQAALPEVA